MNKLPLEKRTQILSMLVEGSSMRSISRVVDVSINTVTRYLELAGEACEAFHDERVRGLQTKQFQADEIWSFCGSKKRNVPEDKKMSRDYGDIWTFTGLDHDSKLIVTWFCGDRSAESAQAFMTDAAGRIDTHVQITTDGFGAYVNAVDGAFGMNAHFAMLQKHYTESPGRGPERKYSPGVCCGIKKEPVFGAPAMDKVCTSHVERHNLTMRMHMKRYARLGNAFSRKFEDHCHALALYFVFYNFVRQHKSIRMTPAMAAGIAKSPIEVADIVTLVEAREARLVSAGRIKRGTV